MTNLDPSELVKLADELIAQNYGNVRDIDTMGEHFALLAKAASALRRLASSDGGVKVRELEWREYPFGDCEADVYSISDTYGQGPRKYALARGSAILGYFNEVDAAKATAQADYEARIKSALVEVPAVKDVPREVFVGVLASLAAAISILERTPKAKKAVASDKMFDTMLDDYQRALEAGRAALTAPGATTKSDGPASQPQPVATDQLAGANTANGPSDPLADKVPCHCHDAVSVRLCLDRDRCYTVEAQPIHAIKIPEYHYQELDMSGDHHGVTSNYGDYTPVTVRGSTLDPSSTRSDPNEQAYADLIASGGIFPEAYQQGEATAMVRHMLDGLPSSTRSGVPDDRERDYARYGLREEDLP